MLLHLHKSDTNTVVLYNHTTFIAFCTTNYGKLVLELEMSTLPLG